MEENRREDSHLQHLTDLSRRFLTAPRRVCVRDNRYGQMEIGARGHAHSSESVFFRSARTSSRISNGRSNNGRSLPF